MDLINSLPYAFATPNALNPPVYDGVPARIKAICKYALLTSPLLTVLALTTIPISILTGASFLLIIPTLIFGKCVWNSLTDFKKIDALKDQLGKVQQVYVEWKKTDFLKKIRDSKNVEEYIFHLRVILNDLDGYKATLDKETYNLLLSEGELMIKDYANTIITHKNPGLLLENFISNHKTEITEIIRGLFHINKCLNHVFHLYREIEQLEETYFTR
jgi:hypothetical protein